MTATASFRKKLKVRWRFFRPQRRKLKLRILKLSLYLVPREAQRVFILTLVVGAICGLAAVGFHLAIIKAENLLIENAIAAPDGNWIWLTVLTPALGGLLSGVLLSYIVPGARGSGIPQVKIAYEIKGGRLPFRDAVGKFFIGVLQIGSGASLGREGPTVHICAGIASWLGKSSALSQQNLKRLLPVGAAAGIAAAFNAPIAAVTFTIEEVVGDLDQTVLSGVIVAAAIAAAIERSILGEHPVFTVTQNYGLHYASSLVLYAAMGVAAAFVSLAFTESLIKLRKWFGEFKTIPVWARPTVGGIVTGVLTVAALYFFKTGGINGAGYETLSLALSGTLAFKVMAFLCVMKLVATVFSYSSGGAGGIFAPALFIGAMLGGMFGFFDVNILNHPNSEIGAFALVGMGAVFAGIIRAPMTSVLIIFEMTGSYGLILPLMIANMTAYGLAKRFRPVAIYEALLEQDGIFLPHRDKKPTHALEQITVREAMTENVFALAAKTTVASAIEKTAKHNFAMFPVVGENLRCVGTITKARLARNLAEKGGAQTVGEIAENPKFVYPEYSLSRAIVRMNQVRAIKIVVIERGDDQKLLGILTMSDIVRVQAEALTDKDDKDNLEWTAIPNVTEPD
ncbi:MAG: chloride channel protein [Acidobacteriota bacterium]|nr:chloride channel protein [Acidobacteriota bacterium]